MQFAGALRVHPNGRSLYVLNRSDATVEFAGRHVHSEGENTVAVFAIDPASGIPSLIQTAETGTFHCRTMSIHPNGGMLVTLAVAAVGGARRRPGARCPGWAIGVSGLPAMDGSASPALMT